MKVATSQYDIGFFNDFAAFADKLSSWVEQAQTADLLLFPEYASMELASIFGAEIYSDLHEQLGHMQTLLSDWTQLHYELARKHNVVIAAASYPVHTARGMVNRVHVFDPTGLTGFQDKCIMTRFENEQWFIRPGAKLTPIQTELGSIGVTTCYDAEFPLLSHHLAQAGCDILLAPSCTDTWAGYHRVATGARARAMENQCFVLHSPTVGLAPWSPAVDENIGRAAVYSPIDRGFPNDGIVTKAADDSPSWLFADLDMNALAQVRRDGQVLNAADWDSQMRFVKPG